MQVKFHRTNPKVAENLISSIHASFNSIEIKGTAPLHSEPHACRRIYVFTRDQLAMQNYRDGFPRLVRPRPSED
jgi:hypothetical protein